MSMDLSSVLAALTFHADPSISGITIHVASPQGGTPGLARLEHSRHFNHLGGHLHRVIEGRGMEGHRPTALTIEGGKGQKVEPSHSKTAGNCHETPWERPPRRYTGPGRAKSRRTAEDSKPDPGGPKTTTTPATIGAVRAQWEHKHTLPHPSQKKSGKRPKLPHMHPGHKPKPGRTRYRKSQQTAHRWGGRQAGTTSTQTNTRKPDQE